MSRGYFSFGIQSFLMREGKRSIAKVKEVLVLDKSITNYEGLSTVNYILAMHFALTQALKFIISHF